MHKLLSTECKLHLVQKKKKISDHACRKSHLFPDQYLPLFGAAFSASLPGTMPASMMAATPAAAVRARPVAMAFLTGLGASSPLSFPGG